MRYLGPFQIALAMLIWSSWGVFIRRLPLPAWAVTYYVGIVASAIAVAVWLAGGNRLRDLWPRGRRLPMVGLGLVFLVNSVAFLTALEFTTVANAVLSHYTAPIFVAFLAPPLLGEKRLPTMPASLLLSCFGLALLVPGLSFQLGSRHLQGLVLGTGSGVAYAFLVLMARRISVELASLPLIFVQNLVIALVLLPFGAWLPLPDLRTLSLLLVLGAVHATVGAMLYFAGIRRVRAQVAAILGYVEPCGAVLLAAVLLGERPGLLGLAGGALILSAGWIVVWDESRWNKRVDSLVGPR